MSLDAALALRIQKDSNFAILLSLAHFGAEEFANNIHSIFTTTIYMIISNSADIIGRLLALQLIPLH